MSKSPFLVLTHYELCFDFVRQIRRNCPKHFYSNLLWGRMTFMIDYILAFLDEFLFFSVFSIEYMTNLL